jgi:hypothetical protein
MMTYPPMMGLSLAAIGGAVLFILAGVFVFMETVFRRYLSIKGYSRDQIETNLPELKNRHDGAWYWIRAGFIVVPLMVWVVISYAQLVAGI